MPETVTDRNREEPSVCPVSIQVYETSYVSARKYLLGGEAHEKKVLSERQINIGFLADAVVK